MDIQRKIRNTHGVFYTVTCRDSKGENLCSRCVVNPNILGNEPYNKFGVRCSEFFYCPVDDNQYISNILEVC